MPGTCSTLDPGEIAEGPALGYGVKAAAAGVAQHIELAARRTPRRRGPRPDS